MKGKITGLFKNIALLSVLQGANYLIPLIVLPYLVRVLGPERFGLLAFSQAFMQYFILFSDYGFNLTATREITLNRADSQKISKICSTVLLVKLGLLVLSFVILSTLVSLIPAFQDDSTIYFICFIQVIGTTLFPLWFFQGMETMRPITIINIVSRALAAIAIFVFIKNQEDLLLAATIQASGWLLAGILGVFFMFFIMKVRFSFPSYKDVKFSLIEGWHVFISTASTSLYTVSNAFVLGLMTNKVIVGYFTGAEKLIKAITGFLTPISQSIYPYINTLAKNSRQDAIDFLKKCLKYIGGGALITSILLFSFSTQIIEILLGPDYAESIVPFRWMAFLPLAIALNNILGIQTMLTFGLKKQFSRILVFCGILNIIILLPLTKLFQAEGAAISVLITESIVALLMGITLRWNGFYLFTPKGAKA